MPKIYNQRERQLTLRETIEATARETLTTDDFNAAIGILYARGIEAERGGNVLIALAHLLSYTIEHPLIPECEKRSSAREERFERIVEAGVEVGREHLGETER